MEALPQRSLNIALLQQMGAFIVWGLSWRIVQSGFSEGWLAGTLTSATALSIVALFGVFVIYVTIRFLRKCDDFQRKNHLNAMALAAGVGFTSVVTLILAQSSGIAAFSGIGLGALAVLMFVTYILSSLIGHWRAK